MPIKFLQVDDASKYLESLTPAERRPVDPLTTPTAPTPSPPTFTAEEIAAAYKGLGLDFKPVDVT